MADYRGEKIKCHELSQTTIFSPVSQFLLQLVDASIDKLAWNWWFSWLIWKSFNQNTIPLFGEFGRRRKKEQARVFRSSRRYFSRYFHIVRVENFSTRPSTVCYARELRVLSPFGRRRGIFINASLTSSVPPGFLNIQCEKHEKSLRFVSRVLKSARNLRCKKLNEGPKSMTI